MVKVLFVTKFVIVALLVSRLSVLVVEAVKFFVQRSVKIPVTPLIKVEKKLLLVALVKLALVEFKVLIVALVIVALLKIGLSVKIYVTFPVLSVETVKLLFVDEAKKVYSEEIEVVAITPLIVEVITPEVAVKLLLLIMLVVSVTPFTIEVITLFKESILLLLIIPLVIVAPLPLTVEARVKLFVEVEIVKKLVVPVLITDCKSVVVETPFTVEVKTVPETLRPFEVIIELVAITPLIVVVKMLLLADWVKLLMIFVIPEDIPFTITSKKFPVEEAVLLLIIVLVPITPFTFEDNILLDEVKLLVVVGNSPKIEVVEITPLILEVRTPEA